MPFPFLGFSGIIFLDSDISMIKDQVTLYSLLFDPIDNLFHLFFVNLVKIIMVSAPQTLGGSVYSLTVWNFFECFDGNLIVMRELLKEFKVFLEPVTRLFRCNIKGLPSRESFPDKLAVCHIRWFFQSWGRWFQRDLSILLFSKQILNGGNNLSECFGECFNIWHSWNVQIVIK